MIKGEFYEEMAQNVSVFYKFYDKVLGFLTLLELVEKMKKMFWLKSVRVQFLTKKSVRLYFLCYFRGSIFEI